MPDVAAAARDRSGLVLREELRDLPRGYRAALVPVQPRVFVAATQPVDALVQFAAARRSVTGLIASGRTALYVYDVISELDVVDVAVPDTRQVTLRPPVRVRRLAPSLLRGTRNVSGVDVVALETAVVQASEHASPDDVLVVVEDVLRRRLTTVQRLQAACRRGVKGSAVLREALVVVADGDLEKWKRKLRRSLVDCGVVGLESEVAVSSRSGAKAYLDLVHRASRNVFEVDGWASHSQRGRFVADRRRDRWVRREHGLTTNRVAVDELRENLDDVVREFAALCQVG